MQQETVLTPPATVTDVPEAAHHAEAAHHEAGPHSVANSKLAMWLFLASEVMFFTVLIGAYVIARTLHPEEHALLNIPLTSVNSFILLLSSFTVVRSLAGIQAGDVTKLQRSIMMTIILGFVFFAIMMYEYSHLSHEGVTLSSGPFGMAFYTLTGFHGAHVMIGLIWAMYVFWQAFNGRYTKESHWGVEFWGLYWHFVDVVWIFIFTVVYLL